MKERRKKGGPELADALLTWIFVALLLVVGIILFGGFLENTINLI